MQFKKVQCVCLFFGLLFGSTVFADVNANQKQPTYAIHYPAQVNKLLAQLNPQELWDYLNTYSTKFTQRGADHDNGVQAANWIQKQVTDLAKYYGYKNVSVYQVETTCVDSSTHQEFQFPQPSIIAKIGSSTEPGIVVGAHLDAVTCPLDDPNNDCGGWGKGAQFPGADDDGSGAMTVLELARILFTGGMQFKKPVYLMWYAAEEMGSIGSQCVVANFKQQNIPIQAVMQLDMTGYTKNNDSTVWLEKGRAVNPELTEYLKTLVETYVKKPVAYTCSGDSDEWSWTDAGVPAARPVEVNYCKDYNPYVHKPEDTIDKLSLSHMTDYAKLAMAFIVELAEPVNQ